jgi:regulation of enolase protein 1 (concanavalin A-like superfamily)
MRCASFAMTFVILGSNAFAQDLGSASTRVALPGITFNLALNEAEKNAKVDGGKLTLSSPAKRDNFRDPDGKLSNNTAPMLLSEVDNSKPFTFSAKVTPSFQDTYDAGALYIWVRDDLWLKMAMERDERARTRLVSVRTTGTSDDNNHDVVTAKSVYMKISSDTKTVGFYYSLDNEEWQLIRLFKNEYPEKIWLGVSSQSPVGNGNSSTFENIALTQRSIADFRLGK